MLTVRKIDLNGQYILGALMIISILMFFVYAFGAGLFILGCWQMLSAAFNTYGFIHAGFKKEIRKYWTWVCVDLLSIILCWPLSVWVNPDDVQVLFWIATTGSVPIALCYWNIYSKLISYLELKKEMSAFTKSKTGF